MIHIVIQGTKTPNLNALIHHYQSFGKVIDATWDDVELLETKVEILKNKIYNYQNIYLQVVSTLRGLCRIPCDDWVIKTRSDEYYQSMDVFIREMQQYPDRITTNNVFVRKHKDYPYHMSDHLMGGTLENMMILFSSVFNYLQTLSSSQAPKEVSEQIFTRLFIEHHEPLSHDPIKSQTLLTRYFHMVPIRSLGHYRIRSKLYPPLTPDDSTYYTSYINVETMQDIYS